MAKIEFESVETNLSSYVYRAAVPGGWLVLVTENVYTNGATGYNETGYEWRTHPVFIQDPEHTWLKTDEEISATEAIEAMKLHIQKLQEAVYNEDIPHPTVPEYREHHESILRIKATVDNIARFLKTVK